MLDGILVRAHGYRRRGVNGYSDRINHALAFAAKHHDQQVRKGTRLPYVTNAANVAIILTRYGQDDGTVVAGILHDVVDDCVREGWTRAMLESRLAEKFGGDVLEVVLAVTRRRLDDDGTEMDREQRGADYVKRLATADDRARWVAAAHVLHDANTVLADLRRTVDPAAVWSRNLGGRAQTISGFGAIRDALSGAGFSAPIMAELRATIEQLEAA